MSNATPTTVIGTAASFNALTLRISRIVSAGTRRPRRFDVDAKRLPQRIVGRPQTSRQFRADDEHRGLRRRFLLGESAPTDDRDAEQIEVIRRHEGVAWKVHAIRLPQRHPRRLAKQRTAARHRHRAKPGVAGQRLVTVLE